MIFAPLHQNVPVVHEVHAILTQKLKKNNVRLKSADPSQRREDIPYRPRPHTHSNLDSLAYIAPLLDTLRSHSLSFLVANDPRLSMHLKHAEL